MRQYTHTQTETHPRRPRLNRKKGRFAEVFPSAEKKNKIHVNSLHSMKTFWGKPKNATCTMKTPTGCFVRVNRLQLMWTEYHIVVYQGFAINLFFLIPVGVFYNQLKLRLHEAAPLSSGKKCVSDATHEGGANHQEFPSSPLPLAPAVADSMQRVWERARERVCRRSCADSAGHRHFPICI